MHMFCCMRGHMFYCMRAYICSIARVCLSLNASIFLLELLSVTWWYIPYKQKRLQLMEWDLWIGQVNIQHQARRYTQCRPKPNTHSICLPRCEESGNDGHYREDGTVDTQKSCCGRDSIERGAEVEIYANIYERLKKWPTCNSGTERKRGNGEEVDLAHPTHHMFIHMGLSALATYNNEVRYSGTTKTGYQISAAERGTLSYE